MRLLLNTEEQDTLQKALKYYAEDLEREALDNDESRTDELEPVWFMQNRLSDEN